MLEPEEHWPMAIQDDRGHQRKAAVRPAQNRWLQRTLSNVGEQLAALRDRVMGGAELERHSMVLDLNAGSGLLTWEAVRRAPVGGVWALAADEQTAQPLRVQSANLDALSQPAILSGALDELPDLIAAEGERDVRFDAIVGRNALTRHPAKVTAARIIASLLADGGRLSLAEVVPHHAQRLHRLVDPSSLDESLRQRLIAAEEAIYTDLYDPMVNWDAADLKAAVRVAGLSNVQVQMETVTTQRLIGAEDLARWFSTDSERQRTTYAQHLRRHLSADELAQIQALFEVQLRDQSVAWTSRIVYLVARR
jgi:putative ATPase